MPLCRTLAGAQAKELRRWAAAARIALRQWMCVDDFIFQAAPTAAPLLVATYEQLCAEVGTQLVRHTCKAYWPAYAPAMRSRCPDAMHMWATQQPIIAEAAHAVDVTIDHLTVLGNAIGGDYAADIAIDAHGAV